MLNRQKTRRPIDHPEAELSIKSIFSFKFQRQYGRSSINHRKIIRNKPPNQLSRFDSANITKFRHRFCVRNTCRRGMTRQKAVPPQPRVQSLHALLLLPVEQAITNRFGDVMRFNIYPVFEVCDRPRDATDLVIRTGGKSQFRHRLLE